tara:strand:+ start:10437 stop:10802 length:366 start_codon:yes stop_codon:yes gene_type:complete
MAQGKVDFHKIYEDKNSLAFLDIAPTTKGQTLIIPKKHHEYIFDLDDEEYQKLFLTAKLVAKAMDKALKPIRTCIIVEGFQMPHLHIRLHPCYKEHLEIQPGEKPSSEDLFAQAEEIRKFL